MPLRQRVNHGVDQFDGKVLVPAFVLGVQIIRNALGKLRVVGAAVDELQAAVRPPHIGVVFADLDGDLSVHGLAVPIEGGVVSLFRQIRPCGCVRVHIAVSGVVPRVQPEDEAILLNAALVGIEVRGLMPRVHRVELGEARVRPDAAIPAHAAGPAVAPAVIGDGVRQIRGADGHELPAGSFCMRSAVRAARISGTRRLEILIDRIIRSPIAVPVYRACGITVEQASLIDAAGIEIGAVALVGFVLHVVHRDDRFLIPQSLAIVVVQHGRIHIVVLGVVEPPDQKAAVGRVCVGVRHVAGEEQAVEVAADGTPRSEHAARRGRCVFKVHHVSVYIVVIIMVRVLADQTADIVAAGDVRSAGALEEIALRGLPASALPALIEADQTADAVPRAGDGNARADGAVVDPHAAGEAAVQPADVILSEYPRSGEALPLFGLRARVVGQLVAVCAQVDGHVRLPVLVQRAGDVHILGVVVGLNAAEAAHVVAADDQRVQNGRLIIVARGVAGVAAHVVPAGDHAVLDNISVSAVYAAHSAHISAVLPYAIDGVVDGNVAYADAAAAEAAGIISRASHGAVAALAVADGAAVIAADSAAIDSLRLNNIAVAVAALVGDLRQGVEHPDVGHGAAGGVTHRAADVIHVAGIACRRVACVQFFRADCNRGLEFSAIVHQAAGVHFRVGVDRRHAARGRRATHEDVFQLQNVGTPRVAAGLTRYAADIAAAVDPRIRHRDIVADAVQYACYAADIGAVALHGHAVRSHVADRRRGVRLPHQTAYVRGAAAEDLDVVQRYVLGVRIEHADQPHVAGASGRLDRHVVELHVPDAARQHADHAFVAGGVPHGIQLNIVEVEVGDLRRHLREERSCRVRVRTAEGDLRIGLRRTGANHAVRLDGGVGRLAARIVPTEVQGAVARIQTDILVRGGVVPARNEETVPVIDARNIVVNGIARDADTHLDVLCNALIFVDINGQRNDVAVQIPSQHALSRAFRLRGRGVAVIEGKVQHEAVSVGLVRIDLGILIRAGVPVVFLGHGGDLNVAAFDIAADDGDIIPFRHMQITAVPIRVVLARQQEGILIPLAEKDDGHVDGLALTLCRTDIRQQGVAVEADEGVRLVVKQNAGVRIRQLRHIAADKAGPPRVSAGGNTAGKRAGAHRADAAQVKALPVDADLVEPDTRRAGFLRRNQACRAVQLPPDAELIGAQVIAVGVLESKLRISQILAGKGVVVVPVHLAEGGVGGDAVDIVGGKRSCDYRANGIIVGHHAALVASGNAACKVAGRDDRRVAPAAGELGRLAGDIPRDAADVVAGGVHGARGVAAAHRGGADLPDQAAHAAGEVHVRRSDRDVCREAVVHRAVVCISDQTAHVDRVRSAAQAVRRDRGVADRAVPDGPAVHAPHQRAGHIARGKRAVAHMAVLDHGAAAHLRDHTAVIDVRRNLIIGRIVVADLGAAVVLGDKFFKDNVFQRSVEAAEQAVVVFIPGVAGVVHVAVRVHVAHAGNLVHADEASPGREGAGGSDSIRCNLSGVLEQDRLASVVRNDRFLGIIDTAVQLAVKALAAVPQVSVEALPGKIQIRGQAAVESVGIRIADRAAILRLVGNILPEVDRNDALVRQ